MTRRIAAAVLTAAVLAGVPAVAEAAPTLRAETTTVPKGAARSRYQRGKVAYESERWHEAGQAFSDVLDQIPEGPKTRAVRSAIVLDSIGAYQTAYETTGDAGHLHTALETYYRYFAVYKETYNSPNIPRPVVVARFALRDEIKRVQSEAAIEPASEPGTQPAPTDDGSNPPAADPAPTDDGSTPASTVSFSAQSGKSTDGNEIPLIASGAAVLALGLGASSMIAVGAIGGKQAREDQKLPGYSDEQRDRIDQQGKTMNAVFIAGLVATPVLVGTGATLLGIGLHRRQTKGRITAIAPKVRGNFVGVTVTGRF